MRIFVLDHNCEKLKFNEKSRKIWEIFNFNDKKIKNFHHKVETISIFLMSFQSVYARLYNFWQTIFKSIQFSELMKSPNNQKTPRLYPWSMWFITQLNLFHFSNQISSLLITVSWSEVHASPAYSLRFHRQTFIIN